MDQSNLDISEYMKINLELKINFDQLRQRNHKYSLDLELKEKQVLYLNKLIQTLTRENSLKEEKLINQCGFKLDQKE